MANDKVFPVPERAAVTLTGMSMEPVRVKMYGLFWITKRRYVMLQVMAGAVLLAIMAASLFMPQPPGLKEQIQARDAAKGIRQGQPFPPSPEEEEQWVRMRLFFRILQLLPWILLGAFVLGGIESYFVLKRFAQKERQLQNQKPETKS